jgi:hypothetical protein
MKVTKKDLKRIDLEKLMDIILNSNDILNDNLIHAIKYGDEQKIAGLIKEKFAIEGVNEFICELKPKLQNINNDYKNRNIRENILNEINFSKYLFPLVLY